MKKSLSAKGYVSIGHASKLLNMSIDTIRYYEKIDLIPPIKRRDSGYRKLDFTDLLHLKGIAYLRQCGLSTDEIKSLFSKPESKDQVITKALKELDHKISAMQASKSFLLEARAELQNFEKSKKMYASESINQRFVPLSTRAFSLKDYLESDDIAWLIPIDDENLELVQGQFVKDDTKESEQVKDTLYLTKSFEFTNDDDVEDEIYALVKYALERGHKIASQVFLTIYSRSSCFTGISLAGKLFLEIEKEGHGSAD